MAKQLIDIRVQAKKTDVLTAAGDLLAVGVFSDAPANSRVKKLDRKLGGRITQLKRLGDFEILSRTLSYADLVYARIEFCNLVFWNYANCK